MKTAPTTESDTRTPYEKFHSLAKRLISVPKKEIEKREAEYQRTKRVKTNRRQSK